MLLLQRRNRFARIVIAVVKEEHNLAANFFLKFPRTDNFGVEKPFRKKPARLLTETNNRVIHCPEPVSYPGRRFRVAKDSLLQDRRQDQHGCASNKIIPEVTDIRCSKQDEHERLR